MLRQVTQSRPWLVGIDDTDNLESRGTGFRARQLVAALEEAGLAEVRGVTRHQLLVDDRIPYTSHNSCACIEFSSATPAAELFAFCRTFMLDAAAEGSDVGLCLATPSQGRSVTGWGRKAKREVLTREGARHAAQASAITLEGLTGTRDGIIGSLAGIGLFADGNDGRYIWKPGLRELGDTVVTLAELLDTTGIDDVRLPCGTSVSDESAARVALGPWPRPVRVDGQSVLLVEKVSHDDDADYVCLEKQRVKAFRP